MSKEHTKGSKTTLLAKEWFEKQFERVADESVLKNANP